MKGRGGMEKVKRDGNKEERGGCQLPLSLSVKLLKGLRLSCILMVQRYDNGDTKPVYRELAGCSQVEAV